MRGSHVWRGVLAAVFLGLCPAALAADGEGGGAVEIGRRLFQDTCAACHGRAADRRALGKSRPLAGLDAAAIRAALEERRALSRPKTMQDRIKAALGAEDADAVAAYLATLARSAGGSQ